MLTLKEISQYLINSDHVKLFRDRELIYCGYWFEVVDDYSGKENLFDKIKNFKVKKFRCVPEIRSSKWREKKLDPPSEPDKAADYESNNGLEMKLYYEILIDESESCTGATGRS